MPLKRFTDVAVRLPGNVAVLDVLETALVIPPSEGKRGLQGAREFEAFVLRKTDSEPGYSIAWIHLGSAEPINQAVREGRHQLSTPLPSTAPAASGVGQVTAGAPTSPEKGDGLAAQRLRRMVWEPIEPELHAEHDRRSTERVESREQARQTNLTLQERPVHGLNVHDVDRINVLDVGLDLELARTRRREAALDLLAVTLLMTPPPTEPAYSSISTGVPTGTRS